MAPRPDESWLECLQDPILVLGPDDRLRSANLAARRMLPINQLDAPVGEWPALLGFFSLDGTRTICAKEIGVLPECREPSSDLPQFLVRNPLVPEGVVVTATVSRWKDDREPQDGLVLVLHMPTHSRQEIDQLRTSQLFLESIVDNIPAMIFVKEATELRFERFNKAGEELLGLERKMLIGKNDYDFFPMDQAEHFQKLDRETLNSNKLVDIPEEPIRTRAGERWLHTKKIPILDQQGKPLYLLGISLDITARKYAEDQLKLSHEQLERRVQERTSELEQANIALTQEIQERVRAETALRQVHKMEAVGRLAGGVAHDFNNMLTAILGYARLLAGKPGIEGTSALELEQIVLAAERAAGLTRQLLAFSRQQVLKPVVLDLDNVVRGTENMLRRLVREDIDFQVILDGHLAQVLADPGQMEQVILNLVVNARDAMPTGGTLQIRTSNKVVLEGSTSPALPAGEYVCLSVSDTGVGIFPEHVHQIFEPFFTTKPHGQGTGLGLPTAFGIVKQSGGDLVVSSTPGSGSCFRVFLPRNTGESLSHEPPEISSQRETPLKPLNILLVEDEPIVRRTACSLLESMGMSVLQAGGATQALALFEINRGNIDLLLTDIVMPGMSGVDLASKLHDIQPELRIVYMSGHSNAPPGDKFGTAFLQKPFTLAALRACILETDRS